MNRRISNFVSRLVLLVLLVPATQASVAAGTVGRQAAAPAAATTLHQFTAGGHVLGFSSAGVYVASADHAWHVEFVGANGVEP